MTDMEQENYIRSLKYMNVLKELERINFASLKNGSIELHKDIYGNLSVIVEHITTSLTRRGN